MTQSGERRTPAVFAPLEQLGRAEAVTRRLAEAITLGLLAEGEQLPSESELAGQFGVATVTVREALTTLRSQKLVETRRGRGGGSFVRKPARGNADAAADRLRELTLTDIRDIGDHYLAIAGTAAKLAAERASDEDIAMISALAGTPITDDRLSAHREERDFHLQVAAAAQSPRLTVAEMRLQAEFGPLLWLSADGRHAEADCHRTIADAIAAADPDTARAHTEKHVHKAIHRLAEAHLQLS